ncbi:plasmid mobilization relaxosome protein MobC [Streptomyces sp. Ru87]|uniref:plasmid mobilization relaxosome protein MobC n=1 Tax=Streptomyces sp. Ru87 TaxID=2044307 RepID=UPI000BF40A78|nr:plasmid mobilization relaxosome protein MobC [Streptomyces sp. Ru87]PGH49551.1 plasmid mobilization relaxosome protein MobC [Streptomyces sp. Ru87]
MQAPRPQSVTSPQEITTTATSAARYAVGPSKGPSNGGSSAPGVAEELGHQGVPEGEKPAVAEPLLPRAADEAALHRIARRRRREDVQRRQRVDVRYSVAEKQAIMDRARSLNIAGAHLVGAAVVAYLDGDLALSGQRTPLDDYIDELTALRRQVAMIGHNVNQMAKKLNSGDRPHPVDATLLAQTEHTLAQLGATVRHIADAANEAATTKGPR